MSVFETLPQTPRPTAFAFLSPPQNSHEIGRLGHFRVMKLLGEGGMGMVFLAADLDLDRHVALKVTKPEAVPHPEGRKLFLREGRTAAAVENDNVVAIMQVGEDAGIPFLVMPLLKGESLEDRLRRTPKLSAAETARLGGEAAEGLAAAHAVGWIHRDVKPSNLWLERLPDSRDRVKVLDFGLARSVENAAHLTRTDALMGTAGYMAPEQARAELVDSRADLFSLGCVLYRMCMGLAPFRDNTLTAVLLQLTKHNPPAPHVVDPTLPVALSDLTMWLLAKEPANRPTSARQVADALRMIESMLSTASVIPSVPAALDSEVPKTTREVCGPGTTPSAATKRKRRQVRTESGAVEGKDKVSISPILENRFDSLKGWWIYSLIAETPEGLKDVLGHFRLQISDGELVIDEGRALRVVDQTLAHRGNWKSQKVWTEKKNSLKFIFTMASVQKVEGLSGEYEGYMELALFSDEPLIGCSSWIGNFYDLKERASVTGPVYAERLEPSDHTGRNALKEMLAN